MRRNHSNYEYDVYKNPFEFNRWFYKIYDPNYKNEIFRESDEWYQSQKKCHIAVLDHINALNDGER